MEHQEIHRNIANDTEENRGVFSEAKPRNRFYDTGHQTFFSRIESTKRREGEERDPIFGDFVLKIIGTLVWTNEVHWVCKCKGLTVNHPIHVLERIVVMHPKVFSRVELLANALQSSFGHAFVLNGAIQKPDLSDYYMYLKEEYYGSVPVGEFHAVEATGYVGAGYWFLSEEQHIRNGVMLQKEDFRHFFVDAAMEKVILEVKRNLIEDRDICMEVNERYWQMTHGFGGNKDSLRLATAFLLGTLMRSSLDKKYRRNTDESRIALLYGSGMNIGKTLTQKILNLGQGSADEKNKLLLAGGDPNQGGTSIKMIEKTCSVTSMIVMVNDFRFREVNSEALLQYHEGCFTGSISQGAVKPKAAGMILSSNQKEPERLDGRVMRISYKVDPTYHRETVRQMQRLASDYHGFLLAWIIFNQPIWQKYEEETCNVVSTILQDTLGRQERWCDLSATVIYTKFMYSISLKIDIQLHCEVAEYITRSKADTEQSVSSKLEAFVIEKIEEEACHIFTWANWFINVKNCNGKSVEAIAIKVKTLKDNNFATEKEIKEELGRVTDGGASVPTYFMREEVDDCTREQLQQRNTAATKSGRAHRIPLSCFSKDLPRWLNYAMMKINKPEKIVANDDVNLIKEDKKRILDHLEERIKEAYAGSKAENDLDPDEQLSVLMTPESRREYQKFTPRRRDAFQLGLRLGTSKEESKEDDGQASGSGMMDGELEQQNGSFFVPGAIGVLPGSGTTKRSKKTNRNILGSLNETVRQGKDDSINTVGQDRIAEEEPSCRPKPGLDSSDSDDDQKKKSYVQKPLAHSTAVKPGNKRKANSKYCICKEKRSRKEEARMICCDGEDEECPGKGFFHLDCIGLNDVPETSPWKCKGCS